MNKLSKYIIKPYKFQRIQIFIIIKVHNIYFNKEWPFVIWRNINKVLLCMMRP